jgi:hypothetical protein
MVGLGLRQFVCARYTFSEKRAKRFPHESSLHRIAFDGVPPTNVEDFVRFRPTVIAPAQKKAAQLVTGRLKALTVGATWGFWVRLDRTG